LVLLLKWFSTGFAQHPNAMDKSMKEALWRQFGACIDVLENAISACPEEQWDTEDRFWYTSYHCLFYLDYYLSTDPSQYSSPLPFTNAEFEGNLPERTYHKTELLTYLGASREKAHRLLAGLTAEIAQARWVNPYRNWSMFEMVLYNMRHVQHHTAQLNKLLRKYTGDAPAWVARAKADL
jgi:hypothetical protein